MRYITNATAAGILAILSLVFNVIMLSVLSAFAGIGMSTLIVCVLFLLGLQVSAYLCFDLLYWQLLSLLEQQGAKTSSVKGVIKWLMSL